MAEIGTNIFEKLSEDEKKEIQNAGKAFGDIKICGYEQKGFGLEEIIKFIFSGFILKNFIRDSLLWESFKSLIQKIFSIAKRKINKPLEVQIWIRDLTNPAAININFSFKQDKEITVLLVMLREELTTKIFSLEKEQQKGKIIWIVFDEENKVFRIYTL